MAQTKIYISGMTCTSCETIITNELKGVTGVHKTDISCRTGVAMIDHHKKFDINQVIKKINNLDYQASISPVCDTKPNKGTINQWLMSFLIVAALYLAYRIFSNLGVFNWLDINPTNISYGVALLVGVVASMSTCLMVVGAVVISFSAKYKAKGSGLYQTTVRPHLMFHLGRWATFFFLGGVLGLVGSWLNISDNFIAWFTIIIAVILAWLGLNILGLAPALTKFGFGMPKGVMKTWDKLQDSDHALAPMILGGLTFFLPCGFTQSMQLFAMSTGSFLTGAYTLLLFAIGTTPVLFGLGVATTKFSNFKSLVFKQVVGLIVVLFAVYTFSNGSTLLGWNFNLLEGGTASKAVTEADMQVVEMAVNYQGFQPNKFELQVGVPVKWIINGDQVTGCTNEIIVPELGIRKKITQGQNIIEFTPEEVGTINFSCWMGMVKGKFIIKDSEVTSSNSDGDLTCPIDTSGQSNCS